jgi:hypothetical protein
MGLSFKTIHTIKDNNPDDSEDSWNEALMQWILQDYNTEKYGLPSWKSLLKTVSRVDQPLFEILAKEHQVKGIYSVSARISYHDTVWRRCIGCLISNILYEAMLLYYV